MSDSRSVRLDRISKARFRATNVRGGVITMGEGFDEDFSPVELLLAAIAGCTGMDVDYLTGKRADPESMTITVTAEKVRDDDGNHLADIAVTFDMTFPDGPDGDRARAFLPDAVAKSHDRLCTVSRTVILPTPISTHIA